MDANWMTWCNTADIHIQDGDIEFRLPNGRTHRVLVAEDRESYRLTGVILQPSKVSRLSEPALLAWQRNRFTQLVGFRVDGRGRLVGEATVPKVGLQADEFQLYVRAVARECDRIEYLLTGQDVH